MSKNPHPPEEDLFDWVLPTFDPFETQTSIHEEIRRSFATPESIEAKAKQKTAASHGVKPPRIRRKGTTKTPHPKATKKPHPKATKKPHSEAHQSATHSPTTHSQPHHTPSTHTPPKTSKKSSKKQQHPATHTSSTTHTQPHHTTPTSHAQPATHPPATQAHSHPPAHSSTTPHKDPLAEQRKKPIPPVPGKREGRTKTRRNPSDSESSRNSSRERRRKKKEAAQKPPIPHSSSVSSISSSSSSTNLSHSSSTSSLSSLSGSSSSSSSKKTSSSSSRPSRKTSSSSKPSRKTSSSSRPSRKTSPPSSSSSKPSKDEKTSSPKPSSPFSSSSKPSKDKKKSKDEKKTSSSKPSKKTSSSSKPSKDEKTKPSKDSKKTSTSKPPKDEKTKPSKDSKKKKTEDPQKLKKAQDKFQKDPTNPKRQQKLSDAVANASQQQHTQAQASKQQDLSKAHSQDVQAVQSNDVPLQSDTFAAQSATLQPQPQAQPMVQAQAQTSVAPQQFSSPSSFQPAVQQQQQQPQYYSSPMGYYPSTQYPFFQQPYYSPYGYYTSPPMDYSYPQVAPTPTPVVLATTSQVAAAPVAVQPTIVQTVFTPDYNSLDGKRDILKQLSRYDVPNAAIDELAANTSAEDMERLWKARQNFLTVRAANKNDTSDPDVVAAWQQYSSVRDNVVNRVQGDIAVMRVVERNGVFGEDTDRIRAFTRKLSATKVRRDKLFEVVNRYPDNPQHPAIKDRILDLERQVANVKLPKAASISCHRSGFYPIPAYQHNTGLVDAFKNYDILMLNLPTSFSGKLDHIVQVPHYHDIVISLKDIHDALSVLSPEGCHFPVHFVQDLTELTHHKMLNAINRNNAQDGKVRLANAKITNYIRKIKGDALADLWGKSSTDHSEFAVALMRQFTEEYTPEVSMYHSRCIDNPADPRSDVAFSYFLTIPASFDSERRVNIYVTHNHPAVLYPETLTPVKKQLSNLNRYVNVASLPEKDLEKFVQLISYFLPKIANAPYNANAPQIRLSSGHQIAKSDSPPLNSPSSKDLKNWKKLWNLYDSFISAFTKKN